MLSVVNLQIGSHAGDAGGPLAAHHAALARIDDSLVERLGPLIYDTYKDSSSARLAIMDALVRALGDGAHVFNLATNCGQSGDQESLADSVIETVVRASATELRR